MEVVVGEAAPRLVLQAKQHKLAQARPDPRPCFIQAAKTAAAALFVPYQTEGECCSPLCHYCGRHKSPSRSLHLCEISSAPFHPSSTPSADPSRIRIACSEHLA